MTLQPSCSFLKPPGQERYAPPPPRRPGFYSKTGISHSGRWGPPQRFFVVLGSPTRPAPPPPGITLGVVARPEGCSRGKTVTARGSVLNLAIGFIGMPSDGADLTLCALK